MHIAQQYFFLPKQQAILMTFQPFGYHYHNLQVHIVFKQGKLNCKAFTAKFSSKSTFQELWHPQEKTARLNTFTKQTGLNISASKTQVMCINATLDAPITMNGNSLDFAKDFNYLSSPVSKDNAVQKDIRTRLSKAHSACGASTHLKVKAVYPENEGQTI